MKIPQVALFTPRQVSNLFQEPMEQPPLGFSIAEEKNHTVLKTKQVKKLAAPSASQTCFQICFKPVTRPVTKPL